MLMAIVFAQAVTAAHACPRITLSYRSSAMTGPTAAMPQPCPPGVIKKMGDGTNLCESHCLSDRQLNTPSDTPTAAVSLQPPLLLQLLDALAVRSRGFSSIQPLDSAPPPLLRFGRLLM